MRMADWLDSTRRSVRATMDSMTAPRSSASKCTCSAMWACTQKPHAVKARWRHETACATIITTSGPHLVDDEQLDLRHEGAVAALARDDVPLLGRRHDDLRLGDLLPRQLHVARQLADAQAQGRQALAELVHHLQTR